MASETSDMSAQPGVVVHLSEGDPGKHANVLRNVANLLSELGDGTPVELVAHGPGLDVALATAAHADQVRALLARGVTVAACANTMRSRELDSGALIEGVRVVPAGVAELARRQWQGWAYLRP